MKKIYHFFGPVLTFLILLIVFSFIALFISIFTTRSAYAFGPTGIGDLGNYSSISNIIAKILEGLIVLLGFVSIFYIIKDAAAYLIHLLKKKSPNKTHMLRGFVSLLLAIAFIYLLNYLYYILFGQIISLI